MKTKRLVLITSELKNREHDYSEFYSNFKSLCPDNFMLTRNTWLVYTDMDVSEIMCKLREESQENDTVFVSEMGRCSGFTAISLWGWIKERQKNDDNRTGEEERTERVDAEPEREDS